MLRNARPPTGHIERNPDRVALGGSPPQRQVPPKTANARDGSGWLDMATLLAVTPEPSTGERRAVPEPVLLYELICLALLLHRPGGARPDTHCDQCGKPWPCSQVRLACRLREGF